VTALPPNPLGDAAENSLREFGVNNRYVKREGIRIGTYFIEYGASLRATQVTSTGPARPLPPYSPALLTGKQSWRAKAWLHVTGITPALSAGCAAECRTRWKRPGGWAYG
jgi:2-dehydro-3-deoxygluconokinase